MSSWGEKRSGRHLSIQVPAEIKIQLIKNKALTGVGIGYQICEALRAKWGQGEGSPPAVVTGAQIDHSDALSLIATRVCVSRRSIVQVSRGMSN